MKIKILRAESDPDKVSHWLIEYVYDEPWFDQDSLVVRFVPTDVMWDYWFQWDENSGHEYSTTFCEDYDRQQMG